MHPLIWTLPLLRLAAAVQYVPLDESTLSKDSFFEQFTSSDLASSGWVVSKAHKIDGSTYKGKWGIKPAYKYPGYDNDMGLVMLSEADFFAISKQLPEPFEIDGKDLVLQFEVKFQNGISCGGGYLKLLSDLDPEAFSDASRFEIMFGPDICGSNNGVQFIVKKDASDESIDSKLRTPPMAKSDELSALYTLIIRANHDMEMRINGGTAKKGNLLKTPNLMVPPIALPKMIPDMSAVKPADWDERPVIFDESVEKPADYDELHNTMWIPNPDMPKPEGWNDDENEPLYVVDPAAARPEEWDDEEDGEWVAPKMVNPKCVHGCGKWEPPKVVNPNYKGEWVPPAIANPNYDGVWYRPLVENPEYTKNVEMGLRKINAIGIDSWSMQSGVMFSNIYLGHSVEEAERIGNVTYNAKMDLEYANYKATKPRAKYEPKTPPKSFDEMLDEQSTFSSLLKSPFSNEISTAKTVWKSFQGDPANTILKHPIRCAFYAFLFVVAFTLVFGVSNVLLFLYLSSREEAKAHDKKVREELAGAKPEGKDGKLGENDEATEEEIVAKITGKATGASVAGTKARKVR